MAVHGAHPEKWWLKGVVWCVGDTLLHEAVNMSSKVGLVKPNDHIVVVQMISDSLVVKARPCPVLSLCKISVDAPFG